MFITVNIVFKCLMYFSKWIGVVSFGWSSNSGKDCRLIIADVAEDCEGDEIDEESESI